MVNKVGTMMAMMTALSSGMNLQGDYKIPQGGYGDNSRPSTLTDKQKKKRKQKNKARKKANRKNRKH